MRFSTFLLLFLFIFSFGTAASAQNLIYDWSVEEYETCPTGLALTLFVPHWLSFRGNPDYFNTCSPNLGPLTNPFGWQHPRTGEALMGVVTYSSGLSNAREYPGVELLEPMVVGESYDVSYFVATAYSESVWTAGRATNNLGALLMTENYLSDNELGPIPNFAQINVDTVVADTAQWVQIKGTLTADSAYKYIAFGNFFDDENTVDSLLPEREFTAMAYYYFDDFCVVPEGGECQETLSFSDLKGIPSIKIFPNPADQRITISSSKLITGVSTLSLNGSTSIKFDIGNQPIKEKIQIDTSKLSSGIYIILIETEEGITRKKIVIQH